MLFNRFINLDSDDLVLNIGVELYYKNKILNCDYDIVFNKHENKFSIRREIDLFFSYIRSIVRHKHVLPYLMDYNKLIVSKNDLNYTFSYFDCKKVYKFSFSFKSICELNQKELAIRNFTSMWHLDTIREMVVKLLNEYGEKIFIFKNIDFITNNIYEKDIIYEIILNGQDYKKIISKFYKNFAIN